MRPTRRDAVRFAATATVPIAGCLTGASCGRSSTVPSVLPQVAIARQADYGTGLYTVVRRLLEHLKLEVRGKKVVLKPNLVEFDAGAPVNTHPVFVHAVLEAFTALGAASVTIAEGPGHRRITFDLAEDAGYFRVIPGFERLFTDLNLDKTREVEIPSPFSQLRSLHLPETVLNADLLVSLPKMKTHHWVGATLGMKNLFGLVPGGVYGWPKNVLHWAGINECIADLHHIFQHKTFVIADGIDGMEGNGPIQGTHKHAGVVVAGNSLPAVDATCCRIMGIDPTRLDYLNLVANPKQLDAKAIMQIGETVESVRTDFRLLPQFNSIRLGNLK